MRRGKARGRNLGNQNPSRHFVKLQKNGGLGGAPIFSRSLLEVGVASSRTGSSPCLPRRLAAILAFVEPSLTGEGMSSLKEFQCEICGIVSENPIHWFVIECGDQKLAVVKWDLTAANSPTARHFCGEAHAQVYISRWFESLCAPPKPVFKAS